MSENAPEPTRRRGRRRSRAAQEFSEPVRTGVEEVDDVLDSVDGLEEHAGRRARRGLRGRPRAAARRRSTPAPTPDPSRRRLRAASPPPPGRRAGPTWTGPLARACQRADRRGAGHGVAGAVATKPATGVTTDVAIVVADDPDRPDYVSRGGHKLAGALAAFEPAGLVVRRSPLPRCRGVDRRVHRRAAAARRRARSSRSTWATASSPGGCSRTSGCGARPHQRPRPDPRA